MTRAGMTLLEMLLSLALLGAIVAATASWTQIAAVIVSPSGQVERQHWMNAANSVFDLIEQDLQCGDFEPAIKADRAKTQAPRVSVSDGRFNILTRFTSAPAPSPAPAPAPGMGVVIHEYRFDSAAGQLQLNATLGGQNQEQSRPLLDHVKSWQCQVKYKNVELTIESSFGESLQRSYRLP